MTMALPFRQKAMVKSQFNLKPGYYCTVVSRDYAFQAGYYKILLSKVTKNFLYQCHAKKKTQIDCSSLSVGPIQVRKNSFNEKPGDYRLLLWMVTMYSSIFSNCIPWRTMLLHDTAVRLPCIPNKFGTLKTEVTICYCCYMLPCIHVLHI